MEAEHSVSAQARMRVYEQLGDLCAHRKIGFYHAAVQFYLKEVCVCTFPSLCVLCVQQRIMA